MAATVNLPLIVVVGPTASGKSSLAIEVAQRFNCEIICADSRTIYKEMNIGTAKPTPEDQAVVPHWGIDLVSPNELFSVADFKEYASKKITEIRSRGRVPILVGGSGLYVDSLIFDYSFGGEVDYTKRVELERMSIDELHSYCSKNNIKLPENQQNMRHVIRAIELQSINVKRKYELDDNVIVVGIATNKIDLAKKIFARIEHMFEHGVVDESKMLGKIYGWDISSMSSNIYGIVKRMINHEITKEQAIREAATKDRRLAKRQMTWFQRNPFIYWDTADRLMNYLSSQLDQ